LEHCPPAWFETEMRRQALAEELARRAGGHADDGDEARKHGTVGAVAIDTRGNLAAATSTGGMTAKAPGRVGDTPVIGAGTWADNGTCAVSATGHGEVFIRHAVAHELDARLRWAGLGLAEAAGTIIDVELAGLGGSGGLIAVDRFGTIALPFNCAGMFRGFARPDEDHLTTAIYRDDQRSTAA
jgi:L-asparaginase/beta-aspartyl-peptidase (threonine type)